MKHTKRNHLFSAILLGAMSMASPLMAQVGKVTVDKPSFDDLQSPQVGGNTDKKNFRPKDWLEMEVRFSVEMPSSYKEAFVDSVTVKWYVAIDDPRGGRKKVYLEKEIKHVNVPVGEEIYSSVYLSPAAVLRISGSETAGKRVVTAVGGEILVNGAAAHNNSGFFTSAGKPKWWDHQDISSYNKIPLLNKYETPFKFLWWDRYAEIEEPK